MDLVRHVLGGGGGDREDDTDDGMEEEALLLHEADSSSSMVSTSDEEAGADECNPNHNGFDVSLPARHLVRTDHTHNSRDPATQHDPHAILIHYLVSWSDGRGGTSSHGR